MAKKKKCPEFENHERWLVAFADMMTLLFALFVVLYAIAMVNTSKIQEVARSLKIEFGVLVDTPPKAASQEQKDLSGNSTQINIMNQVKGETSREQILKRMRNDRAKLIRSDTRALQRILMRRILESALAKKNRDINDKTIYVAKEPDGIRISLLSKVLFSPGSYTPKPEFKEILDMVSESTAGLGRVIRVEGHTDNTPYDRDGMSNWELSSLRASAVAKMLVETHKYKPGTIYAAGFSDTKPVIENNSEENKALNRRVDLKILYDTPEDFILLEGHFDEEKKE